MSRMAMRRARRLYGAGLTVFTDLKVLNSRVGYRPVDFLPRPRTDLLAIGQAGLTVRRERKVPTFCVVDHVLRTLTVHDEGIGIDLSPEQEVFARGGIRFRVCVIEYNHCSEPFILARHRFTS
jgi:hypothetical protein